jgi:diacylglycerol kinase (ATP)
MATFKSEPAFRQEITLFIVGMIVAILLPVSWTATALLISALILILLMELVNTAIETIVDRVSDERHPLSKKSKRHRQRASFVGIYQCDNNMARNNN